MIDKNKVLFILNSNSSLSALSSASVDLYQGLRGITTNHRLSMDFGTSLEYNMGGNAGWTAFRGGFLTTVSDYIKANDITCVLCALGVPYTARNTEGTGQLKSLQSILGGAVYFVENSTSWDSSIAVLYVEYAQTTVESGAVDAILVSYTSMRPFKVARYSSSLNTGLPFGRLGVPMTTMTNESLTRLGSIVSNCMQAESPTTYKKLVVGLHDRLTVGSNAVLLGIHGYTVIERLKNYVLPEYIFYYKGTYDAIWPTPRGIYLGSSSIVTDGTLNPKQEGHLFLGTALANTSSPWYNSFTFLPGSLMVEGTSYDTAAMNAARSSNLDVGLGTVDEPIASGAFYIELSAQMLADGHAAATVAATCAGRTDLAACFGDPLYSPFAYNLRYPPISWIQR